MTNIYCHIVQTNPLPFMVRWNVYDVNPEGKETWIARFRDEEDAMHFTHHRWG